MNATQISATYKASLHFLMLGQLKNAFEKTSLLVDELQIGTYADKLSDIQQNYRYLLQYYVSGVKDPQRKLIYNKLIARIFVLNNELKEELLLRNSSVFEYAQKRYLPHTKRHATATELFDALSYFHRQSEILVNNPETHEVELKRLRANYESALPELFSLFWLTSTYTSEEKNISSKILSADYPGNLEKSLLVSALTLNLWRMFDEQKLMMLIDCCQLTDPVVKQRAMVGLWFLLFQYSYFLPFFPAIRNRLVLMADDFHAVENFKNIVIQVISTAETDKITRKMREEILPELMKISPLLKNKTDVDNLLNSDEWGEANPDWQEIIENSGATEKIKELTDLQMEGADVYMSTFAVLKSFPFFSELSNWFLPFDGRYSAVNQLFRMNDNSLLTAFVGNNVMCNSDKYSFCLSILQMPESQRAMLTQSFKMEAEQLSEITKDEAVLTPDLVSKNVSKQYIQDLFRFFRLHPQHTDFSDMFVSSLSMHQSYLFNLLAADTDFVMSVASYYFTKLHYKQALDLFEFLAKQYKPTAELYQKIGYCFQQKSQLQQALEAYSKADIIQPDDLWTIRKMALCYRLSGNFTKALEFYQHADFIKPNQPSILLQVGKCQMALRNFKAALDIYIRLENEDGNNPKVLRAITWCAFVAGNISQADYFMQRLLELSPNERDYLNAGHIAWCSGRLTDAVDFYRRSEGLNYGNWDVFLDIFRQDKPFLLANGIDADEIPLMLDELNPLFL